MLRIGTRGSDLALWQARFTQEQLSRIGVDSELVIIKTKGDEIQHLGFDKMEGKGFFTKEIEDALLRGDIDVAVHSMKDLSTIQPEGLVITAVSHRENPADLLIIRKNSVEPGRIFKLKEGAVVGTSSARRKAQLQDIRPDVVLQDIRGNVPTRLEKLRTQGFDAIFLAAAGVQRLAVDLSEFEVQELNPREFVPAPAQGVLAWQCHAGDLDTRRIFKKIHDNHISPVTNVERGVLRRMDGGCQLPLGVFCERDNAGNYHAYAACEINGALQRVRRSSSTWKGLAQTVYDAFGKM